MSLRRAVRRYSVAPNDVQSDWGYYVKSGRSDAGGVNPRVQGPLANRYYSYQRAQRKQRSGPKVTLPQQRRRWS